MRKNIFLGILLIISFISFAQQKEANIWIFGKKTGLNFNTTPPTPVNESQMLTFEGCASIADSDGNLLFYTDGTTVWNSTHSQMTGGTNLGGHMSSTQSGIIVPQPEHPNMYFIFTVPYQGDVEGLQYSVVDMNEGSGLGAVIELNNQLVTPVTEKVTAMKHWNNEDIWVITHKWETMEINGNDTSYYPSNEFYAYKVTEEGIQEDPVVSSVGLYHGGNPYNTQGYLKGSPDGTKLALAIQHSNTYQLFDFDNESGIVSNSITFSDYKKAYGLEFSPNSRILYISEEDDESPLEMHVYQVDLFAGDSAEIVNSVRFIGTTTNEPSAADGRGALQVGPDQKIYIARAESNTLGVINNPNLLGAINCNLVNDGIQLWNGTSHVSKFGLPTFIQSYFSPPAFIYEHVCYGDETEFTVTSDITGYISIEWSFGDGATSNDVNPTHIYDTPGEYVVTLEVHYETTYRTAEETITILTSPIPDFHISPYCFGSETYFYDDSDPVAGEIAQWLWDFGDGGTSTDENPVYTFSAPSPHEVSLQVTTDNGCMNTDSKTINQIAPPGKPATPTGESGFCQGTESTNVSSQGSIADYYSWEITPASAGTIESSDKNATIFWDPTFSGIASITITAYNICDEPSPVSDPLDIEVFSKPEVFAGEDKSILYDSDVIIGDADASGEEPLSYLWTPADSLVDNTEKNPTTIRLHLSQYLNFEVTDGNGCVADDDIYIDVFGGPLSVMVIAVQDAVCKGNSTTLTAIAGGGSQTYSYQWSSNPPGFNSQANPIVVSPDINTTYTVVVNDGNNEKSADKEIEVKELPTVMAGQPLYIPHGTQANLQGEAYGGSGSPWSWHWEPADSVLNPNTQNTTTHNLYSTTNFILEAGDSFGCQNFDTTTVYITGGPLKATPSAAEAAICHGYSTQLFANPSGGDTAHYSYNWSSNPSGLLLDPESETPLTKALFQNTVFTVIIDDGSNTSTATVTVEILPLPEINLIPDWMPDPYAEDTIFVCVYDTIILNPGDYSYDASFLWSNASPDSVLEMSTTGIGFDMQSVWVEVTNNETECFNRDTLTVIFSFAECTGTEEYSGSDKLLIYPNPANDKVNILISGNIPQHSILSLRDNKGSMIFQKELSANNQPRIREEISVKNLSPGLYIISLYSDKGNKHQKLLIH